MERTAQNANPSHVAEIRARARANVDKGAVTDNYGADLPTVLRLLDAALATEIVCVLRYKRHAWMAVGLESRSIADEFHKHAAEEQEHADQIAARIVQLGGEPDLTPDTLSRRSHAEYVPGRSLREMLQEDLVAERVAIESYGEMIRYIGDGDPTTRRMLESILATEEEHAEDLVTLLRRHA